MTTRLRSALMAISLASLWFGCATNPPGVDLEYTEIPGTRMSANLPPGYTLSDEFAGFYNAQGASLLVTEWSRSESTMLAEIDFPEFAKRGMSVVGEERVVIDGEPRRLVHVIQAHADSSPIDRWILIVGDDTSTSVLTATSPHRTFPPELDDTLRSVHRDGQRSVAPFVGLGFELDEGDSLVVSARIAEVVYMTSRGAPVPPSPEDPQLIAGRAVSPSEADLPSFAMRRLALTPDIRQIEALSNRHLEVGGLTAYELVARAQDVHSGESITLLQTIAIDGRRYYLVQGRVASGRADEYLPEFRKVAASLRRTD